MAKRRDSPKCIIIMGFAGIVAFGLMVGYFNKKTPILKLSPILAEEYDEPGISARFYPSKQDQPPFIQVLIPDGDLATPETMWEIGALALVEYLKLAPKTRVNTCMVMVEDEPKTAVKVTLNQAHGVRDAKANREDVIERLEHLGCDDVELTVVGPSRSAAKVNMTARVASNQRPERVAKKVAVYLSGLKFVGQANIVLRLADGKELVRTVGKDVPKRRTKRKKTKKKRRGRRR